MVNPEYNRINYCKFLRPEDGYELNQAVCLTYSLDFVSLLSAAIALMVDDETIENYKQGKIPPAQLVKTLLPIKDKLVVITDIAQIKKPKKDELYSIFDSCIQPYRKDLTNAFHPKVWIVEYIKHNEGGEPDYKYKAMVSSKNLTQSKDLEFGVALLGRHTNKNLLSNVLADGLLELLGPHYSDFIYRIRHNKFGSIYNSAQHISDVFFSSVGDKKIFKDKITEPVLNTKKDKSLVMSPFIDSKVIQSIYDSTTEKIIIITRPDMLNKIPRPVFSDEQKVEIYILCDYLANQETKEDNHSPYNDTDIHAKLFFLQLENNKQRKLIFGSANATTRGLYNNVEADVYFNMESDEWQFDDFVNDLIDPSQKIFIKLKKEDIEERIKEPQKEDDAKELLNQMRIIMGANISGRYDADKKQIIVTTNCINIKESLNVTIAPFQQEENFKDLKSNVDIVFDGVELYDASKLFVVTITNEKQSIERIMVVDSFTGLENRNKAILDSRFKTFTDALDYFVFLLSDKFTNYEIEYNDSDKKTPDIKEADVHFHIPTSFYEKLLVASYQKPERIKEILDRYDAFPKEIKDKFDKNLFAALKGVIKA